MHFIRFSCLIALALTSSTVVNKGDKSGFLVLLLIFEEKHVAFKHRVCDLIYNLYYVVVHSFCAKLLRDFIMNVFWMLSTAFSASMVCNDHVIFSHILLMMM